MRLLIDTSLAASSLYFNQLTQLEGVEYLLQFAWSAREEAWYLTIADQDGNPLAQSLKLVLNVRLLRRFTSAALPPGVLFLADFTGTGLDMTQPTDLGVGYQLAYVTSDDPLLAA